MISLLMHLKLMIVLVLTVNVVTIGVMYYVRDHGHPMHWLWVWGPAVVIVASLAAYFFVFMLSEHYGLDMLNHRWFDASIIALAITPLPMLMTLLAVWVKLVRVLL